MIGWILFTAYYTLSKIWDFIYGENKFGISNKFLFFSGYFILGICYTHFYHLVCKRIQGLYQSLWKFSLSAFVGVGLFSVIVSYIDNELLVGLKLQPNTPFDFLSAMEGWTMNIRILLPWFFCYHTYKYSEAIQKEKAALYSALKEAELDNLRNQLNPHFLFNTLNGIKALIVIDPVRARDVITQLADLLRVSLDLSRRPYISVEEELQLADSYMHLGLMRFDDRLKYTKRVVSTALAVKILPLSIQTLLENAVKHGISGSEDGGEVTLDIDVTDGMLFVIVTNPGVYNRVQSKGIGLLNLEQRLSKSDKMASLTIQNEQGRVVVKLLFPLKYD